MPWLRARVEKVWDGNRWIAPFRVFPTSESLPGTDPELPPVDPNPPNPPTTSDGLGRMPLGLGPLGR